MGGRLHLKLNIGLRPIANKYREGKMKSTLERELKVPEIAKREANGTSFSWLEIAGDQGEFRFRKGRWFDLDVFSVSLDEVSTCFGCSGIFAFRSLLRFGVVRPMCWYSCSEVLARLDYTTGSLAEMGLTSVRRSDLRCIEALRRLIFSNPVVD